MVVMVVVRFIEISKICQPLQIWLNLKNQNFLSPKSQIYQKLVLQSSILEQIFILSKSKRPSYTYKKLSTRLQYLGILILNAISELRLMLWSVLLVGF